MIRLLTRLFILLVVVSQVAANCSGTETGNPGRPPTSCPPALSALTAEEADQIIDDLILTICQRVIACESSITTDTCFNALNGEDGDLMLDEFGLLEGQYTMVTLREGLASGAIVADDSALSTCEGDLSILDCSEVEPNVAPDDFSGVQNFIPDSCVSVFMTAPEGSSDGC